MCFVSNYITRMKRLIGVIPFLVLSLSCSIQKMALVMTAETTAKFAPEVQKYDLPFIVSAGLPTNILIMETARALEPENHKILEALAEIYCSYGFGFVEDEDLDRARLLYYKGYQYAEKALSLKNKRFAEALQKLARNEILPEELAKTITKKDIKTAFWYGSCLAYWINSAGGSPESVAELSKMLAVVDRLIELDEGFFYGGPLLLRASFYATAPSVLGGSPVKARIFFERAFKKSDGKFLLAKAVFVRFYATLLKDKKEREIYDEEIQRLQDRVESYRAIREEAEEPEVKAKFDEQIRKLEGELAELKREDVSSIFSQKTGEQLFDEITAQILETSSDVLPDAVLTNEIAKEKVKKFINKRKEFF